MSYIITWSDRSELSAHTAVTEDYPAAESVWAALNGFHDFVGMWNSAGNPIRICSAWSRASDERIEMMTPKGE